jgi:predicted amidohydrolase
LPFSSLETSVGPVRVGALICFDREFPEAARVLALQGAELMLVPNACDLGPRAAEIGDLRLAQFRARAFESLAAVAMANYAAPQYDGHSVAFQPDGSTIVLADAAEEIVLADVDLGRVRAFRAAEAGRVAARRPDLYAPITKRR